MYSSNDATLFPKMFNFSFSDKCVHGPWLNSFIYNMNGLGWQSRKEKQIINNENGFKNDKRNFIPDWINIIINLKWNSKSELRNENDFNFQICFIFTFCIHWIISHSKIQTKKKKIECKKESILNSALGMTFCSMRFILPSDPIYSFLSHFVSILFLIYQLLFSPK